ncbi:hypothetical protein BGZ73_002593 [Actinomortierella ambigua]|nr:hypothetical protein BGZ73_002593 [Actinomortierella ambigua]
MNALVDDYEKISKRQRMVERNDPLDRLIALVNTAKDKIHADPSSVQTALAGLGKMVKSVSSSIQDDHKELQSGLSKFTKALDKKYSCDMMAAMNPRAFDNKEKLLQKTIAMHFIRQGNFILGDAFAKEAGLEVPDELRHQFMDMFDIVAAMKADDLEPALQWAKLHRPELEKRGSPLEFRLHRQRFLQLLKQKQDKLAIEYAQTHFGYFGFRHTAEISRLMCSVLFMNRLMTSPYADLLAPNAAADIQHMFTRDFCSLIGLSCESPLYVSVTVGTQALPTMIKMASIMKAKKAEWSQESELPVEINLTDDTKFHSIFVCPVSKEQATDENPPMMMVCGHVICKESLQKLCRGSQNMRFKCPYCPQESMASQAKNVYF